MSARAESCTIGTVQGCQQCELIVSWHVGLEEATAGGGFIPLGAAWSSAGVSDLVIRLWGRATQRKSPLNSEEALKACSSLHQKGNFSFSFLDASSDTAGQYTKDARSSVSLCNTPDRTICMQGCALSRVYVLCLCLTSVSVSVCHHYRKVRCKNV